MNLKNLSNTSIEAPKAYDDLARSYVNLQHRYSKLMDSYLSCQKERIIQMNIPANERNIDPLILMKMARHPKVSQLK